MDDGHDGEPAEKGKRNCPEYETEDVFVFGGSNQPDQRKDGNKTENDNGSHEIPP